jgi:N-acetylmuramic acid 6-phosphate etherase
MSSPTEALNRRAARLKPHDTAALLRLMASEDAAAMRAVARVLPAIARVAAAAAQAISSGGRLVYLGAGTSGRLGALDAAECPPTFGARPRTVIALLAGGPKALTRAVEGAEDDAREGARAVDAAKVDRGDVVVGISASGSARWVRAALARAKARRAITVFLTCNPRAAREVGPTHAIVLRTGAEVLAGSTRLKAAAATRSALAMISTGAFARLGKVRGGRMVALAPTNQKLRDRAARNVAALAGVKLSTARAALAAAKGDVAKAVDRLALR